MLCLRRTPWRQPLINCWQCNASITRAAQDGGSPRLVRRSAAEALERLPRLLPDELETLWCLQRFARLFCARSTSSVKAARWPELLAALGPAHPEEPLRAPVGADETEAFTFAIAWHLLTAGSDVVPLLARAFQGRFNQATAFRCSGVLLSLRHVVRPDRPVMTADRVAAAIAALQRAERPVHYATVARELGVDPSTFGKTLAWRALVDRAAPPVSPLRPARRRRRKRRRVGSRLQRHWVSEARKRLVACRDSLRAQGLRVSQQALSRGSGLSLHQIARFQRLSGESLAVLPRDEYATKVAAAVEALRARGARINTVAVTREMGRSRSLIEARPDLKALVREARVPAVTSAMVTAAIDAVLARGERITTRGVSIELGRDRDPFYRKPGLLDLVKAAQARQRDEAAERVRAAVKELQARDEPVTFRAVAAVIGKDEHYFERPAQRVLRELVPSPRARRARGSDGEEPLLRAAERGVSGRRRGDVGATSGPVIGGDINWCAASGK